MHKELVEDRDWMTEEEFLKALSFCMLLPGPEAMQLATYAGWKRRGVIGGLIGGGLFVIPGAVVIAGLALLYLAYGNLPFVQAMFTGIQAVVVVFVLAALTNIGKRALGRRLHVVVAVLAFLALFFFAVPFPVVILTAAIVGAATYAPRPSALPPRAPVQWQRSLRILAGGIGLWALPLLAAYATGADFLIEVGLFFSTLAVVTFGGAYAVLSYMTQEVVFTFGWLTTPQMIDALGLAETTPGPLILVTQFVAMVAGHGEGGVAMAILAGAMTLWVTFVPCFIWIFAGAPLIDWLDGKPRLRAALQAITAAVVGVIASLSLWFAMHVFFAEVAPVSIGPVQTIVPIATSVAPWSVLLAALSAVLIIGRKWPLPAVLCISAALGGFLSVL